MDFERQWAKRRGPGQEELAYDEPYEPTSQELMNHMNQSQRQEKEIEGDKVRMVINNIKVGTGEAKSTKAWAFNPITIINGIIGWLGLSSYTIPLSRT